MATLAEANPSTPGVCVCVKKLGDPRSTLAGSAWYSKKFMPSTALRIDEGL
eukprot:CAMPEP_0171254506 /NCGR_PEP_ID=MMETSP0790-20130122/52268_1 /TAXON_ID=2925 /ORGANISM="Alexandrium catenella, Strain OF101" /LENGTH=50 /DNA_ID=CAMNT_0011722393 /DNA_START=93 /DNA_END=241 /DNA_ORIENTATION=-